MKRFYTLAVIAWLAMSAAAQTMTVWQGNVSYVYPVEALSQMTYQNDATAASSLMVLEKAFYTDAIDSITVNPAGTLASEYVEIAYSGDEARVVVPGTIASNLTVSVSGADVSIVAAETLADEYTYRLTGSSTNGSFSQQGSYKLTLILDDLSLTSTTGAAISIQNGKRIAVQLPSGTTTTLADASNGSQKACFFIKGHAEFSGAGTLNLVGNTKHAYASNEYTILGKDFGTINVTSAVTDGLHVDQYYQMNGGTVNIAGTGGDGIDVAVTSDATDELNGQVLLLGGSVTVNTGAVEDVKGIKSEADFTISGATVNVQGTGDGVKGIRVEGNLYVNGASTSVTVYEAGTTYHAKQADQSKTHGIKVTGDFTFDGGTISSKAPGEKAKACEVDGTYYYISGEIDCGVSASAIG